MHSALKVLVAEDSLINRRLMATFLDKLGHKVFLAENGQEAVDLFVQEQPDLVFMDVLMPVLDGLGATAKIKELCGSRWVPVIIVSSQEKPEQLVAGLEAGADDYLPKPVNFRVLAAKMRSIERTLDLQSRLAAMLRRSKAIADHMLDALITIDDHGHVSSCNPATSRLFGYEEGDMLGENISMLMPEPHQSLHDGYLSRYRDTGVPHVVGDSREVMGKRKDGSVFPIQIGVSELVLDGERSFIGILRDISERKEAEMRLRDNAARLQRYHDEAEEENALAREIMKKQLHRPGLDDPHVTYGVEMAEHFSGDLVAARRSPQGRLYAMLADATGHGLTAAISGLPAVPVFYGMARRNLPLSLIVSEMNSILHLTMASGRFLAVALVCVNEAEGVLEVWNGGMPDLLWLDGQGELKHRFVSRQLPLGILPSEAVDEQPERFEWDGAGQIVMCSDGVLEAENDLGEPFGVTRLLQTLRMTPPRNRYMAIRESLNRHLDGRSASDDASVLVVDCVRQEH